MANSNKVVDKLVAQISALTKENAILAVMLEEEQEKNAESEDKEG